jgi:predicted nucleic acid-binding protein
MVLGIDTDVLVNWMMAGAPNHDASRELLSKEIRRGTSLALTAQVVFEFLHICTDTRRFQRPLRMEEAISAAARLWNGKEIVQVTPEASVIYETLDLLERLDLGRKRILDTALAVTLKQAGIRRLATFNEQDFKVFSFLELVIP